MNAPERKLAEVLLASEIAALQFSAGQEREVDAMIAELKKTVRQMLAEPRFDLVPVAAIDPLMTAVQGAFSSLAADQVLVLKEFLEISTRAAVNGMNKSLGADVFKLPARRLTDDIIIDGTPASNWWSRQAEATQRAFAREVRAGVTSGEGIDEITRRIVGRRGETGILDVSRRQARSLVRSSVLTVSNQGAEDVIQASNDVTNGFIWVSTLDSRSCAYCAPRDLKKYTHAHIPHEHGLSWGFGPGATHFGAIPSGARVETVFGQLPVRDVRVGDLVRTHRGRFRRVTAIRRKPSQGGVVRVIHTQAGLVLRATDDHPVLVSGLGWKLVGALEVGDDLFSDTKQFVKVCGVSRSVDAQAEYGPAGFDEPRVALRRSLELMSSVVNLKSGPDVGSSEIDNGAVEMVLRDPSIIEDQGNRHHLLAFAHLLQKFGRKRLGNLLALLLRNGPALEVARHFLAVPIRGSNPHCFGDDFGITERVGDAHSLGVGGHDRIGLLAPAPSPMIGPELGLAPAAREIKLGLGGLATNLDAVSFGVSRQAAIGKAEPLLDGSEGVASLDVLALDDLSEAVVSFGHDRILSLEVQTYNGDLFDLEVEDDCSYIADGILVSNCRCIRTPWLKSMRELGLDIDDFGPGMRESKNGLVKGDLTFENWIDSQPAGVQKEWFGAGRYEMYRDGKITIKDLTDMRGRELSIAQLRERFG